DGERVADDCCLSDSEQVDQREHYNDSYDYERSPERRRSGEPEETHVVDQQITIRGEGCDASQPDQPADLKRDRRLKRFARVQIWTTSFLEAAAHLRKAEYD